ncbi:hypothetical protein Tco_0351124 [Tanacetum coccineum]
MREDMEKLKDEMRNAAIVDNETKMVRNHGENQMQNMQFTRVTKIEFSKFGGEDVKGWITKPLALPTLNVNWRTRATTPQTRPLKKRPTQKKMGDKRAKNLCFYCDQSLNEEENQLDQLMTEMISASDPTQAVNGSGMLEVPSILDHLLIEFADIF